VGEDLVLKRQKRAARVDEIEARQPILLGDFLGTQVLLDGEREVRAPFYGCVVGDDHAFPALDDTDAGHDPRSRCLSLVQIPGGQWVELEERSPRIDEAVDALAGRQLAAGAMPLGRLLAAAARDLRRPLAQFGDKALHPVAPLSELAGLPLDLGRQHCHARTLQSPSCRQKTCSDATRSSPSTWERMSAVASSSSSPASSSMRRSPARS